MGIAIRGKEGGREAAAAAATTPATPATVHRGPGAGAAGVVRRRGQLFPRGLSGGPYPAGRQILASHLRNIRGSRGRHPRQSLARTCGCLITRWGAVAWWTPPARCVPAHRPSGREGRAVPLGASPAPTSLAGCLDVAGWVRGAALVCGTRLPSAVGAPSPTQPPGAAPRTSTLPTHAHSACRTLVCLHQGGNMQKISETSHARRAQRDRGRSGLVGSPPPPVPAHRTTFQVMPHHDPTVPRAPGGHPSHPAVGFRADACGRPRTTSAPTTWIGSAHMQP